MNESKLYADYIDRAKANGYEQRFTFSEWVQLHNQLIKDRIDIERIRKIDAMHIDNIMGGLANERHDVNDGRRGQELSPES